VIDVPADAGFTQTALDAAVVSRATSLVGSRSCSSICDLLDQVVPSTRRPGMTSSVGGHPGCGRRRACAAMSHSSWTSLVMKVCAGIRSPASNVPAGAAVLCKAAREPDCRAAVGRAGVDDPSGLRPRARMRAVMPTRSH
jgi:hypothetical protein